MSGGTLRVPFPSPACRFGARALTLACLGGVVVVPTAAAQLTRGRARLALIDPGDCASARPARVMARHPQVPRRPARAADSVDDGWQAVNDGISTAFYRFFGELVPTGSGVERPTTEEHMLEGVVLPVGATPLSLVVLGAGNRHRLANVHFHEQYDGIIGIRVGLVPVEARSRYQVSLTVSPLHGSFAQVSRHAAVRGPEPEPMPGVVMLGGAVGVDATYTSDGLALEARAYAMPEMDVGGANATGVSQVQSAQITLPLSHWVHAPPGNVFDLRFVAMHVDHGSATSTIHDWSTQGFRTTRELREVWQGMVVLTLRRD